MKKIIILALATFSLNVTSQTSIQLTNITNTNSPVIVSANSDVLVTTHAYQTKDVTFDIKNISSTTSNTYVVKRYDMLLNITSLDTAKAHFCFAGSCFGVDTYVSPTLSLIPNQSTSEIPGPNFILDAELDEASVVGLSHVKYTIMNIVTHSDSLQFTVKYNSNPTGIKETNGTNSSFEIFPNPAKEIASILINAPKNHESKLVLFNSLGEIVYQKDLSITEGKNKVDINIETLSSGVYFANIKTGGTTISKKLIVN